MNIGLLAYSTNTGLGYQTRLFYQFMAPQKVLIADLSQYNGMPTDHSWAYQPKVCMGIPSAADCEWLLTGMDVVFVCETPLNYHLFMMAKKLGVKIVLQYNYEFFDYAKSPQLPSPTVLAAPTVWNIEEVKKMNIAPVQYWPVPIDRSSFVYRPRKELKRIGHIIGRPAVYDRNGTLTFLEAVGRLGPKYQYDVFLQEPKEKRTIDENYRRILSKIAELQRVVTLNVITDTANNTDMYKDIDLLVMPRRYGGLCLPMQEALSCGIPVIMTNIDPNNDTLPEEWLASSYEAGMFRGRVDIPYYGADCKDLVAKIERLSGEGELLKASLHADKIAESLSWDKLKIDYNEWFCRL